MDRAMRVDEEMGLAETPAPVASGARHGPKPRNTDRDATMVRDYIGGMSLEEVADRYNLSRSRTWRILTDLGAVEGTGEPVRRGPLYTRRLSRWLDAFYRGGDEAQEEELPFADLLAPGEVWCGRPEMRGHGLRIELGRVPRTGELEVFWSKGWLHGCPYGHHRADQALRHFSVTATVGGVRYRREGWACCWESVARRPVEPPAWPSPLAFTPGRNGQ